MTLKERRGEKTQTPSGLYKNKYGVTCKILKRRVPPFPSTPLQRARTMLLFNLLAPRYIQI